MGAEEVVKTVVGELVAAVDSGSGPEGALKKLGDLTDGDEACHES